MQWVRPLLVVLCFTLLAPIEVSAAEGRVALVIGNASYDEDPLRNPVNDSRAIAVSLRQLGFEVIEVEEADRDQMTAAMRRFERRLGPADTGLFYYAGHGVQVDGSNYLIPLEAEIDSKLSVKTEGLNVGLVLDAMEGAGSRLNIVILDACRNNPYERSLRGQSRGLAVMDAAKGTLIAYATAPGSVAADGEGKHGVYTEALLDALVIPGLQVEEVFKKVRIEVERRTDGEQTPWESSSLTGDFVFKPGNSISIQPLVESSTDELYWRGVENSGNAVLLKSYLDRFPGGIFVVIARHKLKLLEEAATTAPDLLITESDVEDPVPLLLASAQESLSALRLTTPEENNAFEQFSEVLGLEPDNVEAKSGLAQIANKYIGLARRAAKRGELDKAKVYLDRAETVTPGNEAIAYARDEIEALAEEENSAQLVEEQSASTSSSLPRCPGSYNWQTWTKCIGARTYNTGVKYAGAWWLGKRHGQGIQSYATGAKAYVGEYRNDERWNGASYNRAGAQKGTYSNGRYTVDTNTSQTTTSTSTQSTSSSSALPRCPGSYNWQTWTKCIGARTYNTGVKYAGAWWLGKRHGQGIQSYATGAKAYVGEYRNDERWNGASYNRAGAQKGTYSNGRYTVDTNTSQTTTSTSTQSTSSSSSLPRCPGSYNQYTWDNCFGVGPTMDGGNYSGEFKNGDYHGQGTYTFGPSSQFAGDKYVGEVRDGKLQGQGTYYYLADNEWKGDKYVGELRDGKKNGRGTYTWVDGDKYVGEFRNDKKHGQGTLYHLADNQWKGDKYVGEFRNGKKHGQGTLYHLADNQWKGDKYVGEFRNGKKHGQGTLYYLADNQWKGDKYVGEWRDGKWHGQGTYTSANGRVDEGIWENGKFLYTKKLTIAE